MSDSEYENMHWKQLKKLVEQNGGEWSNVEAGVDFLENLLLHEPDVVGPPRPEDSAPKQDGVPVLDKEAPFGEIFGTCTARFMQNGHYFGPAGEYIKPENVK